MTVDVNGNPLTFVLDTDASGIVLDSQAAKDLQLTSYGASAMPIRLGREVPVVRVGVGDTTSDDMIVDTGAEAPMPFFDPLGRRIRRR